MNNKFWIQIIKIASILTILLGFIGVLASSSLTEGSWLFLLDLLTYPIDNNPSEFKNNEFILNAVLGGLMMGWGTMMLMLVDEIERSPKIKRAFLVSTITWFIFDSTGSFVSGVYGNILLNLSFFLMILIPLSQIKHPPAEE